MSATSESAVANAPSAAADDKTLLRVENLAVDFATEHGWVNIIDSVSFSLKRGDTLGLVGESGSGKSVTSLAIMGLIPTPPGRIRSGSITLDGRELLGAPERDMQDIRGREMAMIFQEPATSLNPAFQVGDQVAEMVRRHMGASRKEAWARAVDALGAVGIPDPARRAKAYPHEFSGGMRQRVMIAMAISCEPKLLIADEPTTALDVTIQAQVLTLLHDLRDELDMALLLITHDLGVVAQVCDDVLVMYAGQMVERASVVDLYELPRHPYSEGLLVCMPQLAPRSSNQLPSIPGSPPMPWAFPKCCRFHPRCPYADERCSTGSTELVQLSKTRASRCLRVDEVKLNGGGAS
jgi:oligopeptide/dipeptide ABC transporter ATP-binding protein